MKITNTNAEQFTLLFSNDTEPILELKQNGDILVHGKYVETDKEVVNALREFLQTTGHLKIKEDNEDVSSYPD